MNALGQDFDLQHAAGHATQAVGQPQLVVIAGSGVQAHHQPHITQAGLECVDIVEQVVRATFLTGLDQADHSRVTQLLVFERLQCGNRRIGSVAVVRAATAVQLAVLVFGGPGTQVVAPT